MTLYEEKDNEAMGMFKERYDFLCKFEAEDTKVTLDLEEDDPFPPVECLNLDQICDLLRIPSAIGLEEANSVHAIYLRKEFAENYLHIPAERFFSKLRNIQRRNGLEEYIFAYSPDDFDDDFGSNPDWKGQLGVCYFIS